MGLRLDGLRDFTAWIKQGSYYHRVVAQQGHLNKCPHLAGAPVPTRPQIMPSESCGESQKQADTQTTSSSEPNAGATAAPVTETPVMEAPVTETPACSDTPAPMETGRAGDGQSWAKHVEAGPASLPEALNVQCHLGTFLHPGGTTHIQNKLPKHQF